MTDVTLPDGSDPTQEGIARLCGGRFAGRYFSNIGNLWPAGLRALASVPYVMAGAGSGQDPSGALARAATADFRGPLAGMTARDTMATAAKAIYGPAMGAWMSSSQLGPMDDPVRLMAQQAINGSSSPPPPPTSSTLAALLAHLSPDASIPAGR